MRSVNVKSPLSLLTAGGVLAALGASAIPLIHIWQTPNQGRPEDAVQIMQTGQGDFPIVVDLRDNISAGDVVDLNVKYGIQMHPNSMESKDDGLMVARVPGSVNVTDLLSRLKKDPNVEAAEPELPYSIPEVETQSFALNSRDDADLRQAIDQQNLPGIEILSYQDGMVVRSLSQAQTDYATFRSCVRADEPRYPSAIEAAPLNDETPPPFPMAPNDPRYSEQWNFQMIGVESAWKRTQGKEVIVAVIDTGVAGGTVKKGKACRDFGQTAFVKGYNFVGKNDDAFDDHGHGTHVAGTIAESTNNNEGVAGIAFNAKIMPLKVLSASGSGSSADIADAIRIAADNGANVINMSLGSAYPSDVIHKAVKYARGKGVVIVCAAGNSFGGKVGYPAAYPECIAVSAVGPSGTIAKYSSYGKEVALAAPGGDMVDSGNPADGILQNTNFPEAQGGKGDDYYAFQGTSMASPHVAGVAALLVSQGIADPAQVKDLLEKSAKPKGDKIKYGAGILSASQATAKAEALGSVKLRHLLLAGLGLLLFTVGPRRNLRLRLAMFGALTMGFFGPDIASRYIGWDSAWNLLTFSALPALVLYALLPKGPGVKVAGMLGIGAGVCLWANWHNGTLPFSTAAFGDAALPWTFANITVALGIGLIAAAKAYRATR